VIGNSFWCEIHFVTNTFGHCDCSYPGREKKTKAKVMKAKEKTDEKLTEFTTTVK
jgi:hypothetical protein